MRSTCANASRGDALKGGEDTRELTRIRQIAPFDGGVPAILRLKRLNGAELLANRGSQMASRMLVQVSRTCSRSNFRTRLTVITLKNVLVAIDFGEASETALAYGRELARMAGATLHVLHVVENVIAGAVGVEGYVTDFASLQREVEESARKQLDSMVTDEDRRTLAAKTVTKTSNSPALSIVSYARDAHIDLIIVGTHGRGGMAHLFMGSVAERVVRAAPCPVLTVRNPEHGFVLPDALQVVARA